MSGKYLLSSIIRIPSLPVVVTLIDHDMHKIWGPIERLSTLDAPHKIGVSDPVEADEDTIDLGSRNEVITFYRQYASVYKELGVLG